MRKESLEERIYAYGYVTTIMGRIGSVTKIIAKTVLISALNNCIILFKLVKEN